MRNIKKAPTGHGRGQKLNAGQLYPDNLDLSSVVQIEKRRADMPKVYRGVYDRAMRGQSKSAAIHAFCLECMSWQREQVRLCTSYACPLFPYRPYSSPEHAADGADLPPELANETQGID